MAAASVDSPRSVKPLSHNQDIALKILRRLEGPPRRSVGAAEITANQHAMPKSYVSRALLHENPSHDRHLNLTMNKLHKRQIQYENSHHMSRKAFIDHQQRKHKTWKQQDEMKAANINFPNLRADATARANKEKSKKGVDILYKSPKYFDKAEEGVDPPEGSNRIFPYMSIRRERTEFIKYREKTFVSRLPTVIQSHPGKMERYNTYCGKEMLQSGAPLKDERFQKLANCLSYKLSTPGDEGDDDEEELEDFEEEDEGDRHGHLVTQSLTTTPRLFKSEKEALSSTSVSAGVWRSPEVKDATSPRQSPASMKKSRVIFPSLSRSKTFSLESKTAHEIELRSSLTRERTQDSLQVNGRRDKIKKDLRSNGADGLRHKYGKLKSSYKEKDILEEEHEVMHTDVEGHGPSSQIRITVQSVTKTPAEEE